MREYHEVKDKEYQPLFRAFLDEHGLKVGDKYSACDYLLWNSKLSPEQWKRIAVATPQGEG